MARGALSPERSRLAPISLPADTGAARDPLTPSRSLRALAAGNGTATTTRSMATWDGNVQSGALVRDLRAESRALGQAWLSLQDEVEQLERHKSLLRHEWRDLEAERERLGAERTRFEKLVKSEWFPAPHAKPEPEDRTVLLNVGGQIFQVAAALLLQDRFSLLAATCTPESDSILRPGEDGAFFFDRDWFLFRHILSFLQSRQLPKEEARLVELHHEAGFYCLGDMRRQIETVLADMRNEKPPKDGSGLGAAKQRRARDGGPRTARLGADPLPDPFGFTRRRRRGPEHL